MSIKLLLYWVLLHWKMRVTWYLLEKKINIEIIKGKRILGIIIWKIYYMHDIMSVTFNAVKLYKLMMIFQQEKNVKQICFLPSFLLYLRKFLINDDKKWRDGNILLTFLFTLNWTKKTN